MYGIQTCILLDSKREITVLNESTQGSIHYSKNRVLTTNKQNTNMSTNYRASPDNSTSIVIIYIMRLYTVVLFTDFVIR